MIGYALGYEHVQLHTEFAVFLLFFGPENVKNCGFRGFCSGFRSRWGTTKMCLRGATGVTDGGRDDRWGRLRYVLVVLGFLSGNSPVMSVED